MSPTAEFLWLFDSDGCVTFRLLGCCTVTYHNPARLDTFAEGAHIRGIVLRPADGDEIEVAGPVIRAPHAEMVRAGQVQAMDGFVGSK